MKSVIIIPARYRSSRFPGKPLVTLLGKPMILWVAELCAEAVGEASVYVATDDQRIEATVQTGGFQTVLTSPDALTGTDRVAEAATQIEADIYVNVQGDEPTLSPDDIRKVIQCKGRVPNAVINGYCPLTDSEDAESVNIPKVVFTERERMVYMSRRPLPGFKDVGHAPETYFKQVCIYAFNAAELAAFRAFGRKSVIESCEDIEILRFIELDVPIQMVRTSGRSLAVDVPEDVRKVETALASRSVR